MKVDIKIECLVEKSNMCHPPVDMTHTVRIDTRNLLAPIIKRQLEDAGIEITGWYTWLVGGVLEIVFLEETDTRIRED